MTKQVILILIFIFLFYAVLIEPNVITVKKLVLSDSDMPNVRIVFVSDFHLSKFAGKRLQRIINKVNEQNADIIISGGDYVINHNPKISMDMEAVSSKISEMKSKYGIYSVLGNHDYFDNSRYIKENLENRGIKILENSNYKLDIEGKPLYIAGISDMQTTLIDLDKALKNTEKPVILVSHSPDITPDAKERVNLILSGHTHGGQVRIPFYGAVIVPSKYGKRYEAGFIENIVYVTKGLGTSIVRARFNCLPEIVVIDFI